MAWASPRGTQGRVWAQLSNRSTPQVQGGRAHRQFSPPGALVCSGGSSDPSQDKSSGHINAEGGPGASGRPPTGPLPSEERLHAGKSSQPPLPLLPGGVRGCRGHKLEQAPGLKAWRCHALRHLCHPGPGSASKPPSSSFYTRGSRTVPAPGME